ncbi:integrase [Synechococcus sp. BS56D]|uniref:site-specific integrase n=1 Tax=Synechococcus sp. BS56D TaxID=2055944 RepID=UPI00103E9052|nr:site-specific integrase [Synechococcus sp. BS56D]TCD56746.1 integrase [Synechococcus sp. BS56D]
MPKKHAKPWETELRNQIRREHGAGWTLYPQSKGTKLTRSYEDGTRQSVMLPVEWSLKNATVLANEVGVLVARMREQGLGLRDAFSRNQQIRATVTAQGVIVGAIDWQALGDAFLETRSDNRGTTRGETKSRINKAIALLTAAKGRPTDGASLMKAYARSHFHDCPAGGEGRKRGLGDVAAFLSWVVEKQGAPARWLPLKGDDREALIGAADNGDDALTPPVKPEQLAALLDALEADGRPELRLAVALVGCFGLRPAELAALTVEDGKLYVGSQVKRNARSMKKPATKRRVIALELDGRGDGAQALQLYDSGLVKLPKSIRTAIASGHFKKVGDAFRQLLDRYPFWQSMVAATPGLVPYSLRHGYAWRAHKAYDRPLSPRDAAALMGHKPGTHLKYYGRWTDEQGLEDAVARLMVPITSHTPLGRQMKLGRPTAN